ncbi:MAG: divalent-cation tolerance protein CutA [Gammaproteobacteria bacterium]|nr:divalent-cation tolerance protein CutA [Gammaproteobacteria bacterium]
MTTDHHLVLTTCPHEAAARELARTLLDERLAACVNIVPGLRSLYRWKDGIEEGDEVLLLIKVAKAVYPRLEARIRASHPYELPEIIALDIAAGSAAYLAWIAENCRDV